MSKTPKDAQIFYDENGYPYFIGQRVNDKRCTNCEVLWPGKYLFSDGKGNCDICGKSLINEGPNEV